MSSKSMWYTSASSFGAVLCSTMLFLALAPVTVLAQDPAAENEEDPVEEVVVTGSRIRRSNAESPIPMMSLSEDDVAYSGNIELSRIVRELPSIYEGTSTENSQGSSQESGLATVELRNLGEDRTLLDRRTPHGQ